MGLQFLIHEPLTRFIAQVIAIVLVSRILGLLTRRLGQPMVIAEITAGILLGPSLFGLIVPGAAGALFAPNSLGVLNLVSQLGLVLFMFLIGLELDPKLLKGRGHTSVAISHTSIVVPFALGAGLAFYLYPRLSDPNVSFVAFTLFLGASMSITAFPVLARILSEQRLLGTRVGVVAIACAAVDDVTAWCLLAFVVAVTKSKGIGPAIITTSLAMAYIAVMFWVVRPLLRRLGVRVANREGLTQDVVAVIMLLLFASSWATELIGIHALFGAFLFGAMLPKDGGLAHALADKVEDLVIVVLLPLFFAYSGVRTQIGLLDSPGAWLTCGLIVLVASVGKFGGSAAAARLTGLSWREAGALGLLMNTRGLMELIILNIGLDLGVISPTLFTMLVVMALVTTIMTSPLLHVVYPPAEIARDLIEPAALQAPASSPLQAPKAFSILVCVAHDSSGPGLVSLAAALNGPASAGPVHALHLLNATDRASFYVHQEEQLNAAGGLHLLMEKARQLDLKVKPESFVSNEPANDICNIAEVKEADLVLMGWHKPVLSRTLLGGTVHQVMKNSRTDIGIFVDRGLNEVRRVLVPFVGTPHDRAALALARRLLTNTGAEVTLLHVKKPQPQGGEPPYDARRAAEEIFDEPEGGRVKVQVVHDPSPVEVALKESRKGYDLIVVGVGREWGLERRLFGVQPERLMRESPASLLIVRGRLAPAPEPVRDDVLGAVTV